QQQLVAAVEDLSLGRVTASALRGGSTRDWFYTVDWEPVAARAAQPATASGHWVVFADDHAVAERLSERLRTSSGSCTLVYRGEGAHPSRLQIADPLDADAYARILTGLPGGVPLRGIVHAWSANASQS